MGIGFGGTPIGQRIDVVELSNQDGEVSVVDVNKMTLPMESARFRSLVQGPDGALYAAVDEGTIHKLTATKALRKRPSTRIGSAASHLSSLPISSWSPEASTACTSRAISRCARS